MTDNFIDFAIGAIQKEVRKGNVKASCEAIRDLFRVKGNSMTIEQNERLSGLLQSVEKRVFGTI